MSRAAGAASASGMFSESNSQEENALAKTILERCAYLGTDPIPKKLLQEIAGVENPESPSFNRIIHSLVREGSLNEHAAGFICPAPIQASLRRMTRDQKITLETLMKIFIARINSLTSSASENTQIYGVHCAALKQHLSSKAELVDQNILLRYLCAWLYMELHVNRRTALVLSFSRELEAFYNRKAELRIDPDHWRQLTLLLGEIYVTRASVSSASATTADQEELLRKANSFAEESLELCRSLGSLFWPSVEAATLDLLGKIARAQRNFSLAAEYFTAANSKYKSILKDESLSPETSSTPEIADTYCALVNITLEQLTLKKETEARVELEEGFETVWKYYEETQKNYKKLPNTPKPYFSLEILDMLRRLGKLIKGASVFPLAKEYFAARAEEYFRAAIGIYAEMSTATTDDVLRQKVQLEQANMLYELSRILMKQERFDEAYSILIEAQKIFDAVHGVGSMHRDRGEVLFGLGRILERQGIRGYEVVLNFYRESLKIFEAIHASDSEIEQIRSAIERVQSTIPEAVLEPTPQRMELPALQIDEDVSVAPEMITPSMRTFSPRRRAGQIVAEPALVVPAEEQQVQQAHLPEQPAGRRSCCVIC